MEREAVNVVKTVRESWRGIPAPDAQIYSKELTDEQAAAARFAGCKIVRCNGGCPCGLAYAFNPYGEQLCFCFLIPCGAFYTCTGTERIDNTWILRHKMQSQGIVPAGALRGAWMIVDEERRTMVKYQAAMGRLTSPEFFCESCCSKSSERFSSRYAEDGVPA